MQHEEAKRLWQLIAPLTTSYGLEVSVHESPRALLRELETVFPHIRSQPKNLPILAVLTCQKSNVELMKINDIVDKEKDRLLEVFLMWAKDISKEFIKRGFWVDYIDPCSGLPMINQNANVVYSEVDGMELLLGYPSLNCGHCKVLVHPEYGPNVASLFTNAPLEVVRLAIMACKK